MANGKAGAPVGNNNAGKGKLIREAFAKYATENPHDLRALVVKCYVEALAGNMAAAALIFDRTEGKAPQALDVTTNDRREIRDLTDEELIAIATGSGEGTTPAPDGSSVPH